MEMTTHSVSWFELPTSDFDRAKAFYSTIFDFDMPVMSMGPEVTMGILLHERESGVGGAIVTGHRKPSADGALVYLNGGRDLSAVLSRVEGAGGKVVQAKTLIAQDHGYFALFNDSEGNCVGLHSVE